MDDVVVEGVVAGLDLAAGDAEHVALAAVFRGVRPHVNYLPTSRPCPVSERFRKAIASSD